MNEEDFAFYEDQIGPGKRKCLDDVKPVDQSDIDFLQRYLKNNPTNNTVSTSSANIDLVIGFQSDTSTSENSEISASFDSALPLLQPLQL